jgi:Ni,Fe-hydrogenase I cytochrome b subunit
MYVIIGVFLFVIFCIQVKKKNPQCELDNVPFGWKNEKNHDIETMNSFWLLKLRRILQNFYFTIQGLAKFCYFLLWMIISPPTWKMRKPNLDIINICNNY